jgi:ubiquinone/menaquinone biosynthesis C-methylase UbiE
MTVVGAPMRDYYERRAREYDDWWHGSGLFARRERPGWHEEVERLTTLLGALPPARTLDVACGTGFLTRHLPGEITALDQSPAMVEIARARMPSATVVQGEAVPLPFGDAAFERLITGHFYGHLQPGDEAARFLAEARRVAGELIVVDSARRPDTGAERWQERRLNDGSEHRVYKRWFTGPELADELGGGTMLHDGDWFVVAQASTTRVPTTRS